VLGLTLAFLQAFARQIPFSACANAQAALPSFLNGPCAAETTPTIGTENFKEGRFWLCTRSVGYTPVLE
jgi:hypothetical protein